MTKNLLNMKRITVLLLFLTVLWNSSKAQLAGTPPYSNLVVGSQADNAFPLNSTTNNVQWIYGPGAFYAGGVSTGMPANPGKITKVYFQIGATASSTVSYSNFTIKLGQPASLASATVFPSAGWITGLTTVFQQSSFTITGASSGAFIEIPLQLPFIYDPTKALVFEMYVTGGTGNQVRQYGGTGNQRMWGTAVNSGTPSAGTGLIRFGIEVMPNGGNDIGISSIDSPTTFCGGPQNIVARVQNYGNNQVSGFNVNWSINGTLQTPITSTAVLDTFNGANPTWTQISLNGAYTFPSTPTIIKAWTSMPNAVVDTMRNNDSAMVTKQPSIQGAFTIDPAGSGPTNFTSFTAAVNALSVAGVCGPVTFTVAPGTYTSQVVIGDIAGASATNTITFDGVNPTTRIISANVASSAVVLMNNSKFITFKNFTVTNTTTGNCAGIAMVGSVRNMNIINNRVNLPVLTGTSTSGYGIAATGTAGGIGGSAMNGDSILIDGNIITGGGYAITVYGMSNAANNRGIVVTNNTVISCNYMGGYIAYNYNPVVVKNNIFNMNGFQYGYYGLYFYYNQSSSTSISHELIGNTINGFGGYGIYLYYPLQTTTAAKVKCYNNIITSSTGGSYPGYYGIYLYQYNTACNADVYHNTVVMNGTGTSTTYTCFYNTGSTNTKVKNNIFAVYGGSYTPMYLNTSPTGNNVNFNIYYNGTNPVSGSLVYRNAATFTPANYLSATAGGDSSYNVNPSFFSRLPLPGNLHLTDGCNGYGTDLRADVPNDIDGDTFSITPTIGADQFTGGVNDNLRMVTVLTPVAPIVAGAQDVSFIVKNIGANPITSYSASYKLNALTPVTQIKTSTVAVCALDTVLFTGADQVTLGSLNNLTFYTSSPNTNVDADATNDTLRSTLMAPLNGVYTVGGTAPDFATIIDATNALANGVGGPVTFDIRPGTYTGQVVVNGPIAGASAVNTITYEGNDKSTRIVTSAVAAATFLINNASYIKVQNLTINNTNTSSPVGFAGVSAGSSNTMRGITVKRCNINIPIQTGTSSTGNGIIFTGTSNGTGFSNCGADSTVIDSNVVTGGGYAITHYGSQNAAYNRGVMIRGNTLNNINYMGIYAYYNYNPMVVNNNTINLQGQNYGYYGIYFNNNQSNNATVSHELIGNRINNFGGYGIYCYYPINSAAAAKVKLYNNVVIGGTGSTYPGYYGIYLYQASASYLADVYHNTSIMNGSVTSTSYSAFYNTGSTLTNVKNNIFVANAPTYTPMYLATNPGTSNVNYNIYYNSSNPTTGTLGYRNGIFFTPANYLTTSAGGDSSFNLNPPFIGGGNYNLTNGCLRGVNLTADVPNDIAGTTRSMTPNIGAYEAISTTLDISPTMILAPAFPVSIGLQDMRVVVRNNGSTAVTSFDLTYKLNNGTPVTTTFVGNLATCDTVSVYFTGTQQINLVNPQNSVQIYTSSPNLSADGMPSNDTLVVSLSTPLIGNYIIGNSSPSDYPSFNAAVDAMKIRGVGGTVKFLVRTGTYTESVNISGITGVSASSPVSFTSMANHRDSVTLQWNSTTGNAYVARLASSYVTLRNMSITQLNNTATVIDIDGTVSDTLENCKITSQTYSPTSTHYTIKANGAYTDSLVVRNCLITGYSYYGVYIYATSSAAAHRNTIFEGNTLQNLGYTYLYYFYYVNGLKFMNNTIVAGTTGGGTSCYLYHNYNNDGFTYTGNNIIMDRATNYTYLGYYSINTVNNRGLVANNVINYTASSSAGTPYLGYASQYLSFLNNTIRTTNSTYGAGYYVNYNCVDYEFKNNVIQSTNQYAINYYQLPISNKIDFNNYFTTNATKINVTTPAATYATINAWKAINLGVKADYNSLCFDPGFTSATNLVPNPANANSWSLNGRAMHDSRVTKDFNNTLRPATTADGVPDLGAYEFTPTATPPACTAVPATPVAGGTQAFIFGGDTVAKVTYDAFSTPPSSMVARLYSGVAPQLITGATAYPYFYVSFTAPAGLAYNYLGEVRYKSNWMGTLPSETQLRFANKVPSAGWNVMTSTFSTVDTINKVITGTLSMTELPAVFTMADDLNPLPVSLVKFNGQKVELAAKLNWSTVSEKNSSVFNIERSFDAKEFETIGAVNAKGNSSSLVNYSFNDESAFMSSPEVVYYRLKMIDRDGSSEYSKTIAVRAEDENKAPEVKVYPNPFKSEVLVENVPAEAKEIKVMDISGRVVYSQKIMNLEGTIQLSLPANLENGIYFMMFEGSTNELIKLIKN